MRRVAVGVVLAGVTLLERNLAFLGGIFPTVGLSLRDTRQLPGSLPPSVEIVPDVVTGSPLAGIASVLARFRGPVFVHAVYGAGCLPHIERLLEKGAHSILDLLPEVRVAEVPFSATRPFFNVNTPEDWETARRLAGVHATHAPAGPPAVLGVVGRPGSGKTTLIERLIPEFTRLGLKVTAVKSVARFDIDTPGKDSWRHGRAGAEA